MPHIINSESPLKFLLWTNPINANKRRDTDAFEGAYLLDFDIFQTSQDYSEFLFNQAYKTTFSLEQEW